MDDFILVQRSPRSIPLAAVAGVPVPQMVQMIASATNVGGGVYDSVAGNNFTYKKEVQAGNAILILCTWPNGSTPTFTDNNGNTWPAVVTAVNNIIGNNNSGYCLLTGARAGVTTIKATFASAVIPFHWNIIEYYNVTGHNGVSPGSANATGPSLSCGSFTPGNNNAGGGNLIVSYFAISTNDTTTTNGPNPWTAGSGQTLLEADMSCYFGTQTAPQQGGFAHATQSILQTTAAAINPAITATSDTTNTYNCFAVALTVGAAGTPRPSTIWIAKIIHQSINGNSTNPSTVKLQVPWIGNLRFAAALTGNTGSISATDSDSSTWVNEALAENDLFAYAQNTAPDANSTITFAIGAWGGNPNYTFRFYDIVNAPASAFDNFVSGPNGGSLNGASTLIGNPVITPVASSGLMIANVGLETGPGLSVTAPVGAVYDMTGYTGETDQDNYDNADLACHFYFSSNAQISCSWTLTNQPSNNSVAGSYAITFKGS